MHDTTGLEFAIGAIATVAIVGVEDR